ncbi:MAG: dipeptide epimerase, partial [Balneolaceae bacterium]
MPEFQIHTTHFPVHLKHAFTISRGTKSIVTNVAITITANDITGIGEAAPNRRFNEDAETVDLFMKKISPSYRFKADSVDDLLNLVNQTDLKAGSAAAALEMAWWDW